MVYGEGVRRVLNQLTRRGQTVQKSEGSFLFHLFVITLSPFTIVFPVNKWIEMLVLVAVSLYSIPRKTEDTMTTPIHFPYFWHAWLNQTEPGCLRDHSWRMSTGKHRRRWGEFTGRIAKGCHGADQLGTKKRSPLDWDEPEASGRIWVSEGLG